MLLLLLIVLGVFLFYSFYWKRRNFPNGPLPLPLIGNAYEMFAYPPADAFIKWYKEYGPIYTMWMGEQPIVTINDYETIKKTFIQDGDKYADRPDITSFMKYFRGGTGVLGVLDAWGEPWRQQRRFALHTLRDFGMGRNLMEQKILSEVEAFIDRLEKQKGKEFSLSKEFDFAVGSIINNVLIGYQFDKEHEAEFVELRVKLNRVIKAFLYFSINFLLFAPWLRHFPIFKGAWNELMANRDALFDFFREQMNELRESIDYDSQESTTFVEAFFKEQKKHEHEPDCGGFSNLQLENVLFDLWSAALETVSNTLAWAVAFLLHHPEVCERAQAELDRVVQSNRLVTMSDKTNLPYINAIVSEVQRLANIVPQNIFHATQDDVVLGGKVLPKGTLVNPQISCVLYDETVFPKPRRFNPARFVNADGSYKKIEGLIPFSVGKRQCLGSSLAQMELFLFIANLLNRFKLSAATLPSLERVPGATLQPLPYTCSVTSRISD